MRRGATLLLAAGSGLAAALAAAAPAPTADRRVSLTEALGAADRLAEMSAATAAERVATAAQRAAGRPGDLGASLATRSITARESLAVSLPLSWLLQRGPGRDAARGDLEAATSATLGTRLEARQLLQGAWFSLAASTDRASAQAGRAARLQSIADAVGTLFDEGRVARLDRTRAASEAALAASDALAAEENRRNATARLAILLGLDPDAPLVAEPRVEPGDEPDLASLRARAREATPAVLESAARARAGSARVDLARRLRWPGFGVEAGADFDDPTQPGTDKWIGVALTIPLSGGPALERAQAEQAQADAALERARREAATGAESAWHVARAARLRYLALTNDVLPAAREAAELSDVAYQAGRTDLLRLLEAERALAESQLLHAEAYEQWGTADAELRRFLPPEAP